MAFFQKLSIPDEEAAIYTANLDTDGVRCTADLSRMNESELKEAGFKKMDARKVLEAVQGTANAPRAEVVENSSKQAFLTHNWGEDNKNHELVADANTCLKTNGVKTWFVRFFNVCCSWFCCFEFFLRAEISVEFILGRINGINSPFFSCLLGGPAYGTLDITNGRSRFF
jgi:hypothetical protein